MIKYIGLLGFFFINVDLSVRIVQIQQPDWIVYTLFITSTFSLWGLYILLFNDEW